MMIETVSELSINGRNHRTSLLRINHRQKSFRSLVTGRMRTMTNKWKWSLPCPVRNFMKSMEVRPCTTEVWWHDIAFEHWTNIRLSTGAIAIRSGHIMFVSRLKSVAIYGLSSVLSAHHTASAVWYPSRRTINLCTDGGAWTFWFRMVKCKGIRSETKWRKTINWRSLWNVINSRYN